MPDRKAAIRTTTILFIALLLTTLILVDTRGSAFLQVTHINVGQGDSALLRDPNGFTILIDGGKTSAGPTLVNTLKNLGILTIDVMIASHADSDHIGGLITVLQAPSIAVHRVLYNGYAGSTATWDQFVAALNARGLSLETVQFPQTLQLGQMTVQIMNPAAGLINPETNDASVVLKITYGAKRFLFTGDIDSAIEATVIARQTPLASDILKVTHHGSAYSSSPNFIASVQPKEAVISVGTNSYGHPAPATIAILATAGARVWRTDQAGDVIINSDGITYTVLNIPSYVVFIPMVSK